MLYFSTLKEDIVFNRLEGKQTWPTLQKEILFLSSQAIRYTNFLARHAEM